MIFKTSRTVESLSYKQKVLLMVGIFLCIELGLMVSSEFSVALPKIIEDIGGVEFYSLVFTVNLAVSAIVTPIVGKLSDMYGRRRLLIIGILIILVSEVLTPLLVSNIYHLMIFRGIQGLGGAATAVVGLVVISDIFDIENRAKFLGFYGALNALTAIVAPTVGGIFVQYMSWHWVFYSIAPVGLFGLFFVIKYMPEIPKARNASLDFKGITILSIAILTFVAITTVGGTRVPWLSLTMLMLVLALVAAVTLFITSQKKSVDPIIPLHLFKYRVFIICLLSVFAMMFAATGLIYFLPMFLQNIYGFTPTETGLFMTYRGVTSFIFAAISGFIVAKLKDFRLVAIGAMIIFGGTIFVLTFFTTSISSIAITIICLIWGSSSGILISIFHTGIQMNLPNKDISIAMGVVQLFVAIGSLLATSLLGLFLRNANLSLGFSYLLFTCLGVVLFALVVFIVALQRRNLRAESETEALKQQNLNEELV
ncbi:MAG: MFS transporter [Solibacillus sp.]|uniref:MFS transporter n=1 Tax=Solibacillus sp. TaxID=1909654 RepID=UPI003315FDA4